MGFQEDKKTMGIVVVIESEDDDLQSAKNIKTQWQIQFKNFPIDELQLCQLLQSFPTVRKKKYPPFAQKPEFEGLTHHFCKQNKQTSFGCSTFLAFFLSTCKGKIRWGKGSNISRATTSCQEKIYSDNKRGKAKN
jgi:hypothetical protein